MPDQPRVLRVTLFGCPKVIQPDLGSPTTLGQKANELLALLLLRGHHPHHREKLANTLWSDSPPESAAHSFRTTLWRLRRALEPPGVARGTYLSVDRPRQVGFNWQSDFSVDVLDFQQTLGRCDDAAIDAISDGDIRTIESALRLYEGELLEGYFDDWIIYERERLRDLFIRGLICLMQAYTRRGDLNRAIECGRRVLVEDPLRESVHRNLMEIFADVGQQTEAIRLYEQLRDTLKTELAVAPASETTGVYLRITRLRADIPDSSDGPPLEDIVDKVTSLRSSLHVLEAEHSEMTRALDALRDLLDPH